MFLPRWRAGLDDLRIVGIPYGQAAFTQARAVVKVVPDDREVFLIDGHLALVVGAETTAAPLAEAWRRCVKLMAARGATALFYGSTVEQRVSVHRRLLATCPGSGVSYLGADRKAAVRGFYLLVRGLLPKKAIFGRKKNTPEVPKRVTVVTDQRDIAVLAGRWGLATHLVGRSDKPIRAPDVTHHESVGLFEQYLRAGPGRQGGRQ